MGYSDTYEYFLQQRPSPEEILKEIYLLDSKLKELHYKNKFVDIINFRSVVRNPNGSFDFAYVNDILTDNKEPYIRSNIEGIAKLALGSFVYLEACNSQGDIGKYNLNVQNFDYNNISFNDLMNTNQNRNYILSCIPDKDVYSDYFDRVLFGEPLYFSDYINQKNNSVGKNGLKTLSYATAAGKAYAEQQDSGYMQVLYYPILGVCVAIISIIVYLLILLK